MEERAYGVLRRKIGRIREFNVDPVWLAEKLLAVNIIGITDFQRASNSREMADERLRELVFTVMRNGAPNVFQVFVEILLRENIVKWLGEELRGETPSQRRVGVCVRLYSL